MTYTPPGPMWAALCEIVDLAWWERLLDIIPIIISVVMSCMYLGYHDSEAVTNVTIIFASLLLFTSLALLVVLLDLWQAHVRHPIELRQNCTSNSKEATLYLSRYRIWRRCSGFGFQLLLIFEVLISFELDVGW
eukprot:m.35790 g.35790  ORF g.35790 m.35790 type:complete len:134 (-) comp12808_c0_seq1:410-811(-)